MTGRKYAKHTAIFAMFEFDTFAKRLETLPPVQKVGRVAQVTGLVIEADGPNVGGLGRCVAQFR